MQIYNTLTRKKEEFIPIEPGKVRMYVCGPTVYDFFHIGNARPLCVFDVLRRYLEYRGYEVRYVQNFTDVDDKIIRRANEMGVSATDISETYIKEFYVDADGLNVKDATVRPKVTENMGQIIRLIQDLIRTGHAYESNGDVYFETRTFPSYGKLSHMPLKDLEAGARVDVSEQKKDPMDFALWKAAKPGEPFWDSPWGKGRPGWHIECSALNRTYLGETIDIHGGGQDLIFPHHENEIAQSEAATGKPFAHYWMHNGFLNIDNRKMSKSEGNFFHVRDIAKQYGYEPIRYLLLQAQYRMPINYTPDIIEQCRQSLARMYNCREALDLALQTAQSGEYTSEQQQVVSGLRERFIQVMDDDLNTADAISIVFELIKIINTAIKNGASKEQLTALDGLYRELTDVLGLLYEKKEEEIPAAVMELVEKRAAAKKQKDYAAADALRAQIAEMGYLLEETRQGLKIKKK